MDEASIPQLIGLAIALVLSAFFSAAEALLNRLSKDEIIDIVEKGGSRADVITSLLQEPRRYAATIIVAKSCLLVTIVLLVASLVDSLGYHIIASILLIVIFTEIVPKNYIKDRNRNSLFFATRFLQIAYIVLYFVVKPLMLLGYLWVRIFGGKVHSEETLASPEEIEVLINVGDSEEILEKEELDMIQRIFDLPDTVAREVMVPRTDMVCLDVSADMDEILKTTVETRHSRIPVYEDTIDNIIGILHVKDMLDYWRRGQPINIRELIEQRLPSFTPESKNIKSLLQELRSQQRMVIIVDEYGGTAGLLTTEDIIEEIVGEIQDEDETADEWFQIQYVIDATMDIHELNNQFGTNLTAENACSIGKFIINNLGSVPPVGEILEYQNLQFSILETNDSEILQVGIVNKSVIPNDILMTKNILDETMIQEGFIPHYMVDARMDIDELNELLGVNLTAESVDTIGGFIIDLLGEVPEKNRVFKCQGLQFSILEADERRILRVEIRKSGKPENQTTGQKRVV